MDVYISKGEQRLREIKFTVAVPINMQLLLNSAEIMMLNIIRHYTTFRQKFISDSFFRINTGLSKKTIKKAKDSLVAMNIITIGHPCQKGTEYKIEYKTLCTIIRELNNEPNMYRRLELVDEFRGTKNALYTKLREEYKNSNFNNRISHE